jgi:hypothetical protein
MKRATVFVVILVLLGVWYLGRHQDLLLLEFEKAKYDFEEKKYEIKTTDAKEREAILEGLFLPGKGIDIVKDSARVSDYQGVEVHTEALRWQNRWFRKNENHGIDRVGGVNYFDVNKIIFDPDLPERGKPDLLVTVGNVKVFRLDDFLKDIKLNYKLSKFLSNKLSAEKPYDTFTWDIRDKNNRIAKKVKMELWLLEFPVVIRVQPAADKKRTDHVPDGTRHPVTGAKLDKGAEYGKERYGNTTILLKFVPRTSDWYIAGKDKDGLLDPNSKLHIGVAAVECIYRDFEGDPKKAKEKRIGAYIYKGESLALHSSLEDFGITDDTKINKEDTRSNVQQLSDSFRGLAQKKEDIFVNPQLFNNPKYSIIHIVNIGSWNRGDFLKGKRKWADQITVRFVIHAFVVGEWKVKRPHLIDLVPPDQFKIETPSLLSRLLPSFGLGKIGKFLSAAGLILLGLFILAFIFPPVMFILNRVFKVISRLFKRSKEDLD